MKKSFYEQLVAIQKVMDVALITLNAPTDDGMEIIVRSPDGKSHAFQMSDFTDIYHDNKVTTHIEQRDPGEGELYAATQKSGNPIDKWETKQEQSENVA